jgi:tetratricopeptide (TPR) repeat protein
MGYRIAIAFFLVVFMNLNGSGSKPDSSFITQLIKQGQRVEEQDKDSAMLIYRHLLVMVDTASPLNPELASLFTRVARYEYYRGSTEIAISFALRAKEYYQENGYRKRATELMILIGDIVRGNELFEQSRDYLSQALSEAENQHDSLLLGLVYNRMAALGTDDPDVSLDSAEHYAQSSLEIVRNLHNDSLIYNNLNILGVIEILRGNYRKSLDYLKKAFLISKEKFPEDNPLIIHNMARNRFLLGQSTQAVALERFRRQKYKVIETFKNHE